MAGNNVSHSKVHTKRRFLPNLQAAHVMVKGRVVKARVCTRCLRTQARTADRSASCSSPNSPARGMSANRPCGVPVNVTATAYNPIVLEITSRITSSVPPPIRRTRVSRHARSMPVSVA